MYSVLLEALPPTVHCHLSTHTHTHNRMAEEEREIKSSASSQHTPVQQQYSQTHLLGQSSQWNVVEESWRAEESNRISSEQWIVKACGKIRWFTAKREKSIPFKCIVHAYAIWMYKDALMQYLCLLPLSWGTSVSMSGAKRSWHSQVKHNVG